jgi:hypothetical protein
MYRKAVLEALQIHEQKFWMELFLEGKSNCIYWAKLVGIYDPVVGNILEALAQREAGDASAWIELARVDPVPPPSPTPIDYTSNDMTGFMQWFDDSLE